MKGSWCVTRLSGWWRWNSVFWERVVSPYGLCSATETLPVSARKDLKG